MTPPLHLSPDERLMLHQLRLVNWAEAHSKHDAPTSPDPLLDGAQGRPMPLLWILTNSIELAAWQRSARDSWFAAGRRGTLKVVTGAGKTFAALAIMEQLQREDPNLRVAIVVPTIVLMNQWIEVLRTRSNLPESSLARIGGGHSDDFDQTRRVMVTVLASARKELPAIVRSREIGDHLLLIVDECHRAGAPEMSAVLKTPRRYSLGLSATPERDDIAEEGVADYGTSTLGLEIGPIVYEMTFAEATELGILPPFELHHLGLSLSPTEAVRYEALSRSISEARRELRSASPSARKLNGDQLLAWARRVSARGQSSVTGLAYRFVNDTSRRKLLLYHAESRVTATRNLVRHALESRLSARVILFHESITEVVALFGYLRDDGFPVVMEHSELPQDLREQTLDLFRSGVASVIVSARSLIEGFNVPETDLGIIVASSSSPRQRIQSIGRVLRTYRDCAGGEKSSRVCVLYVRDSVDEQIYERENWDELMGLDRNRYFRWDPPDAPVELPGPPRSAIPTEERIDLGSLSVGDTYPGHYEGSEFSTDSHGNVANDLGHVTVNPQGIPAVVKCLKGNPGRFRVTSRKRAILVRVQTDTGGWETLYGGTLTKPFKFDIAETVPSGLDVARLGPGDPYPGPIQPAEEFRFRQRMGGVVGKRVRGGVAFAHGPNADRIVAILKDVRQGLTPVSKIYINQLNHAFWREEGVPRFIVALDGKIEFSSEV